MDGEPDTTYLNDNSAGGLALHERPDRVARSLAEISPELRGKAVRTYVYTAMSNIAGGIRSRVSPFSMFSRLDVSLIPAERKKFEEVVSAESQIVENFVRRFVKVDWEAKYDILKNTDVDEGAFRHDSVTNARPTYLNDAIRAIHFQRNSPEEFEEMVEELRFRSTLTEDAWESLLVQELSSELSDYVEIEAFMEMLKFLNSDAEISNDQKELFKPYKNVYLAFKKYATQIKYIQGLALKKVADIKGS